jgi:hypothetical protein
MNDLLQETTFQTEVTIAESGLHGIWVTVSAHGPLKYRRPAVMTRSSLSSERKLLLFLLHLLLLLKEENFLFFSFSTFPLLLYRSVHPPVLSFYRSSHLSFISFAFFYVIILNHPVIGRYIIYVVGKAFLNKA